MGAVTLLPKKIAKCPKALVVHTYSNHSKNKNVPNSHCTSSEAIIIQKAHQNSNFWNLQGKLKLLLKIWKFMKLGVKLQCLTEKREMTFGSSYQEVRTHWLQLYCLLKAFFCHSFRCPYQELFCSHKPTYQNSTGLVVSPGYTLDLVRFHKLKFMSLNVWCRLLYTAKRVIVLSQANISLANIYIYLKWLICRQH